MTDLDLTSSGAGEKDQQKALKGDLSKTAPVLRSLLRTERGEVDESELEELSDGLSALLEHVPAVHLKLAIDGLYLGKDRVVEIVPQEDRALFRAFQHGIRQLSFLRGVTSEELRALVEVLTSEPAEIQEVEEDVSILLDDRELEHIHLVVVETFLEVGAGGLGPEGRAAELADVVAAMLGRTLSGNPDIVGQTSGGSVRFWAADVTFFSEDTLDKLVAAMPRSPAGAPATRPLDDDEVVGFAKDLQAALTRWTPWLAKAVFVAFEGADDEAVVSLSEMLGAQLLSDARADGLASIRPLIEAVEHRIAMADPKAEILRQAVFTNRLRALALAAIREPDEEALPVALIVFERLTPEGSAAALREVCDSPHCKARELALAALMRGSPPPIAEAAAFIGHLDSGAAAVMLGARRRASFDLVHFELHRAALVHDDPRIRALALSWIAREGGEHGEAAIRRALWESEATALGVTLDALIRYRPELGATLLQEWFHGPAFRKLSMDEKRMGARALAHLAGESVLNPMRKLVRKLNVTGDRSVEELRAAAVVILGVLGDDESQPRIQKLATSRLVSPTLREEAEHVSTFLARGLAPYPPVTETLDDLMRGLGLTDEPPVRLNDNPDRTAPHTPPTLRAREGRSRDGGRPISSTPTKEAAKIPAELVEELLGAYSYDDIPVDGYRGPRGSG